jgi:hypothetical protein
MKQLKLLLPICLATLPIMADSLAIEGESFKLIRPVRWFWFALAGLIAAFIVAKIVNRKNKK